MLVTLFASTKFAQYAVKSLRVHDDNFSIKPLIALLIVNYEAWRIYLRNVFIVRTALVSDIYCSTKETIMLFELRNELIKGETCNIMSHLQEPRVYPKITKSSIHISQYNSNEAEH